MKKILLLIISLLFVFSCDPESVFVESRETQSRTETKEQIGTPAYKEKVLTRDMNHMTKYVSYGDREFLVFYYMGTHSGDIEIIELKDQE